jgi:hypothetical protein
VEVIILIYLKGLRVLIIVELNKRDVYFNDFNRFNSFNVLKVLL